LAVQLLLPHDKPAQIQHACEYQPLFIRLDRSNDGTRNIQVLSASH
jgi:hypothetical protein